MRVLRGLGGRLLECGCLVGTYETYDGEIVTTIDAPGARCTDSRHRRHRAIPSVEPPAEVGVSSDSRRTDR